MRDLVCQLKSKLLELSQAHENFKDVRGGYWSSKHENKFWESVNEAFMLLETYVAWVDLAMLDQLWSGIKTECFK